MPNLIFPSDPFVDFGTVAIGSFRDEIIRVEFEAQPDEVLGEGQGFQIIDENDLGGGEVEYRIRFAPSPPNGSKSGTFTATDQQGNELNVDLEGFATGEPTYFASAVVVT